LLKKKGFIAISLLIVTLMYLVPFFILNGTVGPQTLIFWTLISVAYLVIAIVALRGGE